VLIAVIQVERAAVSALCGHGAPVGAAGAFVHGRQPDRRRACAPWSL